jgi:hypothetical protein
MSYAQTVETKRPHVASVGMTHPGSLGMWMCH